MKFSHGFQFADFFPMSDLEDDISLMMFSGNIYLLNILGSKTTYYEGRRSLSLLNTRAIYRQLSVLHAATRAFSSFLLSSLVPGTLHCNQWAGISILTCLLFLKTFLAHLEPILDVFIASPIVPDDFGNIWNMETYQKINFKIRPILYCFRKTPSKFAFFFRKMAKYGQQFSITFLKNYKSYKFK